MRYEIAMNNNIHDEIKKLWSFEVCEFRSSSSLQASSYGDRYFFMLNQTTSPFKNNGVLMYPVIIIFFCKLVLHEYKWCRYLRKYNTPENLCTVRILIFIVLNYLPVECVKIRSI